MKRGRQFKGFICSLSLSLFNFSLSIYLSSLCPANAVDSAFLLSFFSRRQFKSVIANKPLCWWTKIGFRVFINFSHGEVTREPRYQLKRCDTRINPFEHVVVQPYIYCVTVQHPIWWSNVITFYLVPLVDICLIVL